MSYVGSASLPGSLESIIYIMKLKNPLRQMVICVTFYLYFLYGHQTFSNYDICEDLVVSCILPVNTGACSSSKSELAQEYLRIRHMQQTEIIASHSKKRLTAR